MDFKEYIIGKLEEYTGLERAVIEKSVEVPPEEKLGDLAFPCFPLARVLRKAPPLIAKDMAEKFDGDAILDRCEAVGGYLNFFYNRADFIGSTIKAVKEAGESWGGSDMGADKTVLVEYRHRILRSRSISDIFSQPLWVIRLQEFISI